MAESGACVRTDVYINENKGTAEKLNAKEKLFYGKRSKEIADALIDYLKISLLKVKLNPNRDGDKSHDFVLRSDDENDTKVSMRKNPLVNGFIPMRLMKICGIRGNATVHRNYTAGYEKIITKAKSKISGYEKYSDIPEAKRDRYLILPVRDHFAETMTGKRKLVVALYNHLFAETDRIMIDNEARGFKMYDFSKTPKEPAVCHPEPSEEDPSLLTLRFSNKMVFQLQLRTNSSLIKEHISLKFTASIENLDDLFLVHVD